MSAVVNAYTLLSSKMEVLMINSSGHWRKHLDPQAGAYSIKIDSYILLYDKSNLFLVFGC